MIAFVLLVAVASIWDYPQTLAKRPLVVNRMGMVATTCDDEPPAARPAFAVSGRPLQLTDANVTGILTSTAFGRRWSSRTSRTTAMQGTCT